MATAPNGGGLIFAVGAHGQQRGRRRVASPTTGCPSTCSPTIRRSRRSSSSSAGSARAGASTSSRGATSARSSRSSSARRCSACSSTGAIATTASRSACSARGRRCPPGPATLAAKTGSRILPITIHRQPDDTFAVSWPEPIDVASSDPAELQRATQAIADALAANIGAAPDQWYSFKPMWPATAAEAERPGATGRADAGRRSGRPRGPR